MSACINNGGPASRIRIPERPVLEQPLPLDASACAALRSWQARPGEIITLCGPVNDYYRARLVRDEQVLLAVPFEELTGPAESPVHLSVLQGLPQRERFELVLQKLTELGVQRIAPCVTRHSITLAERDAGQKKSHRWPEVVLRAARQCRRAELPELMPVLELDDALALVADCDLRLVLKEGGAPWRLGEVLETERPQRVVLLVGPEGGFDPGELDAIIASGFLPVSLGSRILRTETAAIVAAALVQHTYGDLG